MARQSLTNDDSQQRRRSVDSTHSQDSDHADDSDARAEQRNTNAETPLPLLQFILVSLFQLSEPVTSSVIFPFINQLIRETGITRGDESKTGYYAGNVQSLFFITEFLTAYAWGRLADKVGRKPVLLVGQLVLAGSMISFGLSGSYWLILVSRAVQGTCNGSIGVSKTMLAEISDSSNMARAFSFQSIIWSTGIIVGPTIGGLLSQPARRWPETFGKIQLFVDRPYLLPCVFAASIPLLSFIVAMFFLEETLPSKRKDGIKKSNRGSSDEESALMEDDAQASYGTLEQPNNGSPDLAEDTIKPEPPRSMLTRPLVITLASYGMMTLLQQCVNILLPLSYSTSIRLGGLGFDAFRIGTILAVYGFSNSVFQLITFPTAHRLFGSRKLFQITFSFVGVCFIALAMQSLFVRCYGHVNFVVWAFIVLQLCAMSMVSMSYSTVFMLIFSVSPSRDSLASVNGIAQMVATISRSIATSGAASLFAVSVEQKEMHGMMVYVVLISLTALGILVVLRLPKSAS